MPLNEKMLMRVAPVPISLLFAIATGCSNDSVVGEKIVEKEAIEMVPVEQEFQLDEAVAVTHFQDLGFNDFKWLGPTRCAACIHACPL